MTSEAQRSFAGLVAPLPLRPLDLGMVGRLKSDALLRIELHVDRVADRRPKGRVAARKEEAVAQLDLEVDELAQEHLLIDRRLPDVAALRPRLGEGDVLGPDRKNHPVAFAQRVAR